MKKSNLFVLLFIALIGIIFQACQEQEKHKRQLVITIDDLPLVYPTTADSAIQMTEKLLSILTKYNIESVGFVNEGKVVDSPHSKTLHKTLEMWLANGQELGNHTYSHYSLNEVSTDSFKNDILLNEKYLQPLLEKHGQTLRYFRHPYLQTGGDSLKKERIDQFLETNGYTQALITSGYYDWLYAAAYRNVHGKRELEEKVANAYIDYINRDLDFNEYAANLVVGREIPMIMMFHANTLNADHFEKVIQVIHQRGYEIVTLEEALQDTIFQLGNPIVTTQPMGWLQRWAIHKGIPVDTLLQVDPFIPELANFKMY